MVRLNEGGTNAVSSDWEVMLKPGNYENADTYHLDSRILDSNSSICVTLSAEEIMDLYETLHVFLMARAQQEGEDND